MRKLAILVAAAALVGGALVARGGSASSGPTYYKDVAPILDAKCASCHRLGGIAPFSLTTAAAAKLYEAGGGRRPIERASRRPGLDVLRRA